MTHFWSSQEEKKNPLIEFLYMALSQASLKNKFPLFNVNVNSCELFFFFFLKMIPIQPLSITMTRLVGEQSAKQT